MIKLTVAGYNPLLAAKKPIIPSLARLTENIQNV